jgi:Mitochondrial carrier protein
MIRDADIRTLVLSSCSAGMVSGVFTNVLEVIKTQVMNDAMNHGHVHGREQIGYRHITSKIAEACRCYYCFVKDMVREQGRWVYFNGVGYNASMTMVRSGILFPLYEYLQRRMLNWARAKNMSAIEFALPTIAGFTAKAISQTITFPLEYMATLRQANIGAANKKMSNGFGYTLYRELLYSACFWTIQENSYRLLKRGWASDANAYVGSAFVASTASAILSFPFDLLKTWKISYPERFRKKTSMTVCREILHERGWSSILPGLMPRIVRVSTGNLIFFSIYSRLVTLLRSFDTDPQ